MMKFKKGNFIDETELDEVEARIFVSFLEKEIERHKIHMEEYKRVAQDDRVHDFSRIVAQTVVVRNLDDIEHTNKTLEYLYKKFNLGGNKDE